jgi:transketolase
MLVYGTVFNQAFLAKELLESKGISVGLINLRTVKPLDTETIKSSIKNCELAVAIEDHFLTGGLYSVLSEIMVKNRITANVLPLALYDRWFRPALLEEVLFSEGFTGPQLAEKIEESLFNNKKNKYYAEWSNF